MTREPSSWLLNEEPELTTSQVWMVLAAADQRGLGVERGAVAIADTAEQAMNAIEKSYWKPREAFNETALAAQIAEAEHAAAHGQSCESVFKLSHLVEMQVRLHHVRERRGNGAMTDGREFPNRDERWFLLEAQKRPGGAAELNANARRLMVIQRRVHALQSASNHEEPAQ